MLCLLLISPLLQAQLPISIALFLTREKKLKPHMQISMAAAKSPSNNHHHHHIEDDYISMEMNSSSSSSSSSNLICYIINSPPQQMREFEFQMSSSVNLDRDSNTSPADELFYKGKLLPLLLPPRLKMVQKLLANPTTTITTTKTQEQLPFQENYAIPLIDHQSCNNLSPSESCRVSCEFSPDDCFFEWSTETNSFIGGGHQKKRSWTRKLKKSTLGQKFKASSVYLKSLFTKSGCADNAETAETAEPVFSKGNNEYLCKYYNEIFKMPNTLKRSIEKEMEEDDSRFQRRSFSGAIQCYSANNNNNSSSKSLLSSSSGSGSSSSSSSSSSFSFVSNSLWDLELLKRSTSASSEIECAIDGAIAHCKKSQQLFSSRKNSSECGNGNGNAACGDP